MKGYQQSLWPVLLLVPLLWLAWPSGKNAVPAGGSSPARGNNSPTTQGGKQSADGGGPVRTRSASREKEVGGKSLNSAESPEVDEILINEAITNQQAAVQLRAIAADRSRPVAQRLEALQHGLNLGIDSFDGFAEQPDLQAELASPYLHEIINHNDAPAAQIRAYIALIGHPDKEVSALAREMIALEVGDDNQQANQEKLIQLARHKLNDLAKDPAQ